MAKINYVYSDAEIKLFNAIGVKIFSEMLPSQIYQWATEKAFINKITGWPAKALRRALIHMNGGGLRGKELDAIIMIDY